MKQLQLPLAALAGLMLLPATSFAAKDLSYSYVELDYIVENVDLYGDNEAFTNVVQDVDDGRGFGLTGSFAFTRNMFVFGKYSNTEADFTYINDAGMAVPEGEDIKTMKLGLGYFAPLTREMDFVARLAYMDVDYGELQFGERDNDVQEFDEIDNAFRDLTNDSSDGYTIDVGVRSQVVEWLEAGGGIRYTDLDSGDDIGIFGNLLFEINPNMGVNLAVDLGDNLSSYSLGLRLSM